ncbi:hypothetical protein ABBQ38_009041 [Trebouxia sp. C0009 RCD-2024]
MKGTLIALSSLAPQYLLSQSSWQAKQYRLQPQSHSNSCSNAASAQQDLASEELSTKGTPDVTQDSEVASQIEVLNVLVSLLEGASGTLGLLLAASLFSCISSFHGGLPAEAVSTLHLRVLTASLDNSPVIPSGLAAQVYLLACLQRLVTVIPEARLCLVSAYIVPKLVFLAGLGHCPHAQTDAVSTAADQLDSCVGVGIHVPASKLLTGMSLGLLSQLVMSNAAVDAVVMQQASPPSLCMLLQLLRGGAVGMLVEMLPYQPAAADLLCFMATQQQCKDAFLDSRVLAGLVDLLHTDPASAAQTHRRKAASILWRVATDCDKAKLEVAKAGVVAPAVAMLQCGCRDHTAAPAAIEAAYLLAVLAEHHCTHQLITTDASIAALLQIMHTAGQARTTSQTLDLDSARTAQQGRHSNGTPSTACLSDRGAGHMAASPAAGMAHQSHAVSDFMRHDEEDKGANAGVESACREEVCRQEQPEGTESSGSSAASAESISHSMDQSYQSNAGSHETGVLNGSSSASEPDQATAGACDGSQEVSSSLGSAGNAQRHDEGSMTESGADGGVDEIDSSSIHSRLLNAARAARTGTSGSGLSGDGLRREEHREQAASLVKDRLLVAANAALASLAGNADTHFAMVNEGAAPALVATLQHGSLNAQALACSSIQAIAASDARHTAVFARVGAIPWLVGLVSRQPSHACGRNAASALREVLQDETYQTEACGCGLTPALVAMLKSEDSDCQAAAAALLHTLAAATQNSRKKAISRAGGIASLVAVLGGAPAEGSMHAAQTLLHLAKQPDLKVLIVQGGAVSNVVQQLNSSFQTCSCQAPSAKLGPCYCTCSRAAAARLLGRLCSDPVAQMQLLTHNPLPALLNMTSGGCKQSVQYHDFDGNEVERECQKSKWIKESAAEYALLKIACYCDDEFRERMLNACIAQAWMGHDVSVGSMLF